VPSGVFGGAAPDAGAALLTVLAGMWDRDGAVAVPGLPSASAAATAAVAEQRPWPEADFARDAGALGGRLVGRGSVTERVWLGPAITVIGVDVPRIADASNTLYPAATARVSMRVPPGGDLDQALSALSAHLRSSVPWGLAADVVPVDRGAGWGADTTAPAYAAARWALTQAWGVAPVDIGIGGSIPFVADLAARLPGTTVLVTGVEDPDSRAHGIDESLDLAEWERACLAEALLLEALTPRAG
jgi:cysteinylglycine-S-conjugate dipeptidase